MVLTPAIRKAMQKAAAARVRKHAQEEETNTPPPADSKGDGGFLGSLWSGVTDAAQGVGEFASDVYGATAKGVGEIAQKYPMTTGFVGGTAVGATAVLAALLLARKDRKSAEKGKPVAVRV